MEEEADYRIRWENDLFIDPIWFLSVFNRCLTIVKPRMPFNLDNLGPSVF